MKTRQELTEILDFIADYATYLLASGVHTSRVIRNSQRIGQSQGVDIQLSSFQKSTILTVRDDATGEAVTRVVKIPALPISFERNSDLSALSWDALDERLPLSEIRRRYDELRANGDDVSLEEIERNVRERDRADMSRAVSPLRQADDAVVLDNSHMTVEEQMTWFMERFDRIACGR